jgi:hypothetical protein
MMVSILSSQRGQMAARDGVDGFSTMPRNNQQLDESMGYFAQNLIRWARNGYDDMDQQSKQLPMRLSFGQSKACPSNVTTTLAAARNIQSNY